MDGLIMFVTVVLVIAYISFAIYTIVRCDTVKKGVGITVAFSAGGCAVIPVASFLATVLCWGIVVVFVLTIIGLIASIFG